jgi:hypothetical protein
MIPHHGGTDPLIAIKVLEHHGIPKAEARQSLCYLLCDFVADLAGSVPKFCAWSCHAALIHLQSQ